MKLIHGLRFDNLRGDIFGGLTTAVVALPLALAFGVASGAGPVAGLYGAIFVGFFAALFGGTPAQVSGPTGPMTVVMAGILTQFADRPALAFTVVMMAGGIQIFFGLLRIGRYITLMPAPVISGFMTGIGCIIIVLQLPPLLGYSEPTGNVIATLTMLPKIGTMASSHALIVGIGAFLVTTYTPRSIRRFLPSPLAALAIGTLAVHLWLPRAPVLGDIPIGFPSWQLPVIEPALLIEMLQGAVVLALLGSIDSLLTSLIADNVTHTQHDSNRELVGQGIGNAIAGMFGAIPGAGATMRTVINVRTGGRTPISGALHAIVLLSIVLGFSDLARHIPHAVLAGILIRVGIDIIDWSYLKRIRRAPKAGIVFMLIVLFLTILVDLIVAVLVGTVLASFLFVKRMADMQLASIRQVNSKNDDHLLTTEEATLLDATRGRALLFHLTGPFSFGSARGMVQQLGVENSYEVMILDMSAVTLIDTSASLAIEDVICRASDAGKKIYIVPPGSAVMTVMEKIGMFEQNLDAQKCRTRLNALQSALRTLGIDPNSVHNFPLQ